MKRIRLNLIFQIMLGVNSSCYLFILIVCFCVYLNRCECEHVYVTLHIKLFLKYHFLNKCNSYGCVMFYFNHGCLDRHRNIYITFYVIRKYIIFFIKYLSEMESSKGKRTFILDHARGTTLKEILSTYRI